MENSTEIFFVKDSMVFYVKTFINGFDGKNIYVKNTNLLNKYAHIGDKVHIKYMSFVLHSRIVGKTEDNIILDFPALGTEKPLGDRKSVRVEVSSKKPIKIYIDGKEKNVHDISETGFSLFCYPDEVENYFNKEIKISLEVPDVEEEIQGTAKLINVREFENGKVLCGFEMFIEDKDMVKIRFYIYHRIKEILEAIK